jgi:hypothetical protein
VLPIRCRPYQPTEANGGRYQPAASGVLVPVGEILIDSALATKTTGRATRPSRRLILLPVLGAVAVLARIEELPAALLVPALIALLAAVDFLLGLVAKSWSGSGSAPLLTLGLALSAVLFWLYGVSLRHGHLSSITLGWVVVLTVADLLVDRFQFGVQLPPSKWLAAAGAVVLLGYLIWPTRH